jgi:hypothetical protein
MSEPREKALWHKAFSTHVSFCKRACKMHGSQRVSARCEKDPYFIGFFARTAREAPDRGGCHFWP